MICPRCNRTHAGRETTPGCRVADCGCPANPKQTRGRAASKRSATAKTPKASSAKKKTRKKRERAVSL